MYRVLMVSFAVDNQFHGIHSDQRSVWCLLMAQKMLSFSKHSIYFFSGHGSDMSVRANSVTLLSRFLLYYRIVPAVPVHHQESCYHSTMELDLLKIFYHRLL